MKFYKISKRIYSNDLKVTEHPDGDWVKREDLNKFAIEQQIEALESLNINPNNESEDRIVAIIEQSIEQLHKEQE